MDKKDIKEIIFDAINEVNAYQDENKKLEISDNTEFIGKDSVLDSLDFVNFIVDVEQRINEAFNTNVILMDEKAMSRRNSPFRNVKTLEEYINTLLGDKHE